MDNRSAAVFFDIGNVLVFFDLDKAARLWAMVFGVDTSRIQQAFANSAEIQHEFERGHLTEGQFVREMLRDVRCRVTNNEIPHLLLGWGNIFTPVPLAISFVLQLQREGITVGLVSNTDPVHEQHWRRLFLDRCFQPCDQFAVLSHKVGVRKPVPEFYRHVFARVPEVPRERVICVDDKPEFVEMFNTMGGHGICWDARSMHISVLESAVRSAIEA